DAALDGPRQSDSTPHQPRHRGREGLTMGQKTHPHGFRLGITKTWTSKWYEEKNFAKWLHEDIKLKKFIKKKLEHAGVAGVDVERAANKAKINITPRVRASSSASAARVSSSSRRKSRR